MGSGAWLNGAKAVREKLKRFKQNFPKEVARALYQETELEAKEVRRRTPVEHGPLRASVTVFGPYIIGPEHRRQIFTRITVGGPSAPYAIYVHEDLEAFHDDGQAKFLESVILESRPYMAQRVAKRLAARLDRMTKDS